MLRKLLNVLMSPLLVLWICFLMVLGGIIGWCFWVYVPSEEAAKHSVTIVVPNSKDEAPLVESMEGADEENASAKEAQTISAVPLEKQAQTDGSNEGDQAPAQPKIHNLNGPSQNEGADNDASEEGVDSSIEPGVAPSVEGGNPSEEGQINPDVQSSVEPDPMEQGVKDVPTQGMHLPPKNEWPAYQYSQKMPHEEAAAHRIVIVLKGVGLETAAALKAIDNLPPQIVIAFSAYSPDLPALIKHSHERGHESLVVVPMEPDDFPTNDPGPMALLLNNSPEKNLQHLAHALEHAQGVVGISHTMGHVLASQKTFLQPIVENVLKRGLIWFDVHSLVRSQAAQLVSENGGIYIRPHLLIDDEVSKHGIDLNLEKLEAMALKNGTAIGVAMLYPVTLDRLVSWAATLESKGIKLVCLTSIVDRMNDTP